MSTSIDYSSLVSAMRTLHIALDNGEYKVTMDTVGYCWFGPADNKALEKVSKRGKLAAMEQYAIAGARAAGYEWAFI